MRGWEGGGSVVQGWGCHVRLDQHAGLGQEEQEEEQEQEEQELGTDQLSSSMSLLGSTLLHLGRARLCLLCQNK